MKSYKATAVIVGILYIIGTVSGILSFVATRNLFAGEDFLARIAMNRVLLNLGAFFVLLMGLSLAAMPIFLYPLLKRKSPALALGVVVFRGPLECSTYILFVINWQLLGAFSREVVAFGPEAASLQVIGNVFLQANDIMMPVLSIVFIIGGLFLYLLFYLARLVPRWLSLWGLIGAVLYVIVDLFLFFGLDYRLGAMRVPLAVQEMAMALWLIAKGFDQAAIGELLNDTTNV